MWCVTKALVSSTGSFFLTTINGARKTHMAWVNNELQTRTTLECIFYNFDYKENRRIVESSHYALEATPIPA